MRNGSKSEKLQLEAFSSVRDRSASVRSFMEIVHVRGMDYI